MTRRVALTGGIATGKSYCLERFSALGAPVLDADLLAREAVDQGTPGFDAVVRRFGESVVAPGAAIDRAALGRIVFSNPAARRDLEAIVHPLVYSRIAAWFARLGDGAVGIADIPLLYETGRQREFDVVIVAACTRAQQLERLADRGLTSAEAEQRLAAQLPIDDKSVLADYVIDTAGTKTETDRQIEVIWKGLRNGAMRQ